MVIPINLVVRSWLEAQPEEQPQTLADIAAVLQWRDVIWQALWRRPYTEARQS
jgi:hypothetical protein